MPQAPDRFQPSNPAPQSGMGFAEQPNSFWKALEGVVNGMRAMPMSNRQPWGMNHEPTLAASQSVGPAMQGGMDVMSDPRNAWMGMGPVVGMSLMGKGASKFMQPNSLRTGLSDAGGFRVPTRTMRQNMGEPRPNLRQGEVPEGSVGIRSRFMDDVSGQNQLATALSDPRHPHFGNAKEIFDDLSASGQRSIMNTIAGQQELHKAKLGYGQ